MKIELSILLLLLLITGCNEEKEVLYQGNNEELLTETQVDSIITLRNKKMQDKNLDMIFRKEITDTIVDSSRTIYKYTIKGESVGVTENVNKYEYMIGKTLPNFSLQNLTGELVNSAQLIGKPMVINMWFTACPPCIAEMPELNKIKAENINSNVQFIAMTYEKAEKVTEFLEKKAFNFEHIVGAKEYCAKFTNQYPINIFVDKEGVINHIEGGMPMIYDPIERKITDKVNPSNFLKALGEIKR